MYYREKRWKKMFLEKGLLSAFLCLTLFNLAIADDDRQQVQLDTITVTAEKREENVQKVTTAISVVSDVEIEDSGIETTRDIWKYIPNLNTANTGSRDYFSIIRLRGISNTAFGDPAVALYIDDVSYAGVYAFDNSLFDIERIEVLKGPQGTLYGKNTEGGAINIISKAPGNVFEGKINLEAGNFNKKEVKTAITGPVLKDTLFFRFSALKSSRDGYIKNKFSGEDIDSQDTLQASAGVLFVPTENLNFDLRFRGHDFDDEGGFPMVVDKDYFYAATGMALDDFEGATNYSGEASAKSNTTSLRTKYLANNFDLISVTAYRKMDNENFIDADFTPLEMFFGFSKVNSDYISQELRLQSKDSDTSFKWLTGLYYSKDKKEYEVGYVMDKMGALMSNVPFYTKDIHQAEVGAEDMAIFGQSTKRFFGNRLGLTVGLRYEHSKRTLDHEHLFGGELAALPINGLETTNSEILPKIALDYRINDNSMTYASISRGYKAGGFTYAVDNPDQVSFDPETSTAFELGIKNEIPKFGLRVNAAVFYTKVDDYQDRVQIDSMTVLQKNVSEADIYGFELETAYALTKDLTLNGFLGYTDAKYGEYVDPMSGENYKDNSISLIPKYDSGLFLKYRNSLGLFAKVGIQHTGSMYLYRTNNRKQSDYTLCNAKIGYEHESWDIYLAAKNLTDKQYYIEGYEDPSLGYVGIVGDPRTISLSFNYHF